ncbi:MAG: aminoacyl-tRNA hydrolase [Alphaproteobacteria bacterium]|nr:aminoacyl-tRNA hydrolase [Alphaproteobacteria bacterium]
MQITQSLLIDEREIHESFVRASGPGGQNVNKVSTAVQIRFDVINSPSLPEEVKRCLVALAGSRLTKEGVLLITAQRFRTQDQNRKEARRRLAELILRATIPSKRRIATKPTAASRRTRLASKAHRSDIKRGRKNMHGQEDEE